MSLIEAVIEQMQNLSSDKQQMVLAFAEFLAQKSEIEKSRYEELRQEILLGVDAADRGEVIDGQELFQALQVKLTQRK